MLQKEIEQFLEEDIGYANYEEIVPDIECEAEIKTKGNGILAGLEEAKQIFEYLSVQYSSKYKDGANINKGDVALKIKGKSSAILKAERVVLNFFGRMSGISTLANTFVREVKKVNANVKIAGTRKTTPGFRKYEKKAIMIGGGDPHRFGLYDSIIIKDNHVKLFGMENAIKMAKKRGSFVRKIEVEVINLECAIKAAELKVDIIMFDNMTAEEVKECIRVLREKNLRDGLILEASGDINRENIKDFSSTGVDVISIGMLTHSAGWLDFSLDVITPEATLRSKASPHHTP